jgi:elongation factor 1 alpha-like protein
MPRQRVKNVDYEDDDYDYDEDYGDEEAEQMNQGIIKVREALGPQHEGTTEKEIRETLYYYYFDVTKSVSYLKSAELPLCFELSC